MNDADDRPHIPDRVVVLLETTTPFERLTPELRGQLISDLLVEYFEPDEEILARGTEDLPFLYVVESGCVRLLDNVNQCLVDLCGEGDTFGSTCVLGNTPLPYTAVAAEPTVCVLVKAERFRALCKVDPGFADFFAGDLKGSHHPLQSGTDAAGTRLLFGTEVAHLVRRKPVICPPEMSVRDAARIMRAERVGSILVVQDQYTVGILTDTDLRNKVVAGDVSVHTPVAQLMSSPVFGLGADASVFDALTRMSRHRVHHLAVTAKPDPATALIGVISDKDIAHASGHSPVSTMKRLEKARSISELARIRTEADAYFLRLHRQGVQAEDVVGIVTEINDRLTHRLLQLAEAQQSTERNLEHVDLPWAWLALGSKGRREMGLRGDQDNALIYQNPAGPEEKKAADIWFQALARRVTLGLAQCGFPFCKGGVMATNPKWCQPLSRWRQIFRAWILEPEPKALMHASIFFDLRGLYGDMRLVNALKADLSDALSHERGFLAFLTHNAQVNRPPLSFFRRFVVERSGEYRNTFDVKLHGLMPLVDLARVLALEGRFLESTNTFDRLDHAGRELPGAAALTANAADAYRYLLDLRQELHSRLLEAGQRPSDHIDPGTLSKTQQKMLQAVFSTMDDMQTGLARRYGAHMMQW